VGFRREVAAAVGAEGVGLGAEECGEGIACFLDEAGVSGRQCDGEFEAAGVLADVDRADVLGFDEWDEVGDEGQDEVVIAGRDGVEWGDKGGEGAWIEGGDNLDIGTGELGGVEWGV